MAFAWQKRCEEAARCNSKTIKNSDRGELNGGSALAANGQEERRNAGRFGPGDERSTHSTASFCLNFSLSRRILEDAFSPHPSCS